jgi:hypothetical protein
MANTPKVLVYGFSGYTGKIVGECLAQRGIPFYASGRNQQRLEQALEIVKERLGRDFEAQAVAANCTVEALVPLFKQVDVVLNIAGPFMQVAWPVVEACLQADCHYLDITGEQDFTLAVKEKYAAAFAAKNLLLAPATAWMCAAGALAAEVCLETDGVDTLDIVYHVEHGLPSVASTQSFLRMSCNDQSQYYLEFNEYKVWPNDKFYPVAMPFRNRLVQAHPWGGACEPIWYKDHERVRNCQAMVAIGEHLVEGTLAAIKEFNAKSAGLNQQQREELTNSIAAAMEVVEPPVDDIDVQRSMVVCYARGRQTASEFILHLAAPYSWTGDLCAEAAERILNGQLKKTGFQSAATAFGHRELLKVWHDKGICSMPD